MPLATSPTSAGAVRSQHACVCLGQCPPVQTAKISEDAKRRHADNSELPKMVTLRFLEESGYFDLPLTVAASQLGLGVTTLKKVCREHHLDRWPFRKRKSMDKIIKRTEQGLNSCPSQGEQEALEYLRQQRQHLSVSQGDALSSDIKYYRQFLQKEAYLANHHAGIRKAAGLD